MSVIWIAVGGAIGALSRYFAAYIANHYLGSGFAYGTLLVNGFGALAIGIIYAYLIAHHQLSTWVGAFLITGFLGALTTFSTFSLETWLMVEQGDIFKALSNVTLNVVVCLLAVWLGLSFVRLFT